MNRYAAYGLTVEANQPLPGLAPASGPATPDVRVEIVEGRPGPGPGEPAARAGWERLWCLPTGERLLHYAEPATGRSWSMRVAPGGSAIDVVRDPSLTAEDVAPVVQTVGLGIALRLRGVPVLHGCAVAAGGGAIVVVGPSGAGKSTLAAAFSARPHRLLTDDVAALAPTEDGGFAVQPGPARLRVLPETARAAGWDPASLPRLFDPEVMGDKRFVELSAAAGTYCPQALPLAGVYELGPRRAGTLDVRPVTGGERLAVLLRNGYRDGVLDRAQRARLLPVQARLAERVPIWRVDAADDLGALPELVEALAPR